MPHSHANPKHAKFCFLCLHGRLQGVQEAAAAGEKAKSAPDSDELPPPAEMQRLGFLQSGGFARAPMDFEQENVVAIWMRWTQDRVYAGLVRPFLVEHNSAQSGGRDVGLVYRDEEERDRDVLARIFSFTERQEADLQLRLEQLGRWCTSRETDLMDVRPEPVRRQPLPAVDPPSRSQSEVLRYRPLLDTSLLRGSSSTAARETARAADAAIGRLGAEGLPRPPTRPDAPEAETLAFPLTAEIVPHYDPYLPRAPGQRPVDASVDPLDRPHLCLPAFPEASMPQFGLGGGGPARGRPPRPALVPEECLSQTCSLFEDNNGGLREQAWGWGRVPPRATPSASLVEDHHLPPSLVVGAGKRGRLVDHCLWDPELHTPAGEMVPPLTEYGMAVSTACSISHPDEPVWTRVMAPIRDYGVKIRESIPFVPVRSYRKFKPERISVAFPRFLFGLAMEDPSGQDIWAVLKQRRTVPVVFKEVEAKRQEREEQRRGSGVAAAPGLLALPAPEAGPQGAAAPPAQAPPQPPARAEAVQAGADAAPVPQREAAAPVPQREVVVAHGREDVPDLEVELPAAPPLDTTVLVPREALAATYPASAAAAPEPGSPPQPEPEATLRPALQMQQQRLLQASGGWDRSVNDALLDDTFMDRLADKITLRLGAGTLSQTLSQDTRGAILPPDLPSFAEPETGADAVRLPPALLQANSAEAQREAFASRPAGATVSDVNVFTQEKMYFDSYVRLLIKPEEVAAQRHAMPYLGDVMLPDISLIMGGKPQLAMPPKGSELDEEGNLASDDDEDEFEANYEVAFSFVRHNRYEPIESLIQQDVDVLSVVDTMGNTLLHVACQNNNRRIAKLLVKHGVKLDAQNHSGNTALHYCSHYGFVQLADFLMANGADDGVANKAGYLPPQGLGKDAGVESVQAGLRAAGAE